MPYVNLDIANGARFARALLEQHFINKLIAQGRERGIGLRHTHPVLARREGAGGEWQNSKVIGCLQAVIATSSPMGTTPRQEPKTPRRVEVDFAASETGGKVRN